MKTIIIKLLTSGIFLLLLGTTSLSAASSVYTLINSGDFNSIDGTVWDIAGSYPTAADTIVVNTAGHTLTIPLGFNAEIGGGDFSGGSSSNYVTLRVDGTLKLFGDVAFARYSALYVTGEVDVNSFWFNTSESSGRFKFDFHGTSTKRARFYSSVPYQGGFRVASSTASTGLLNTSFADLVEIAQLNSAYTYGDDTVITDTVLDIGSAGGRMNLGFYLNDNDFIFKRNDVRSSLRVTTNNADGFTGSGLWDWDNNTFASDSPSYLSIALYGSVPGKYLGIKNSIAKNFRLNAEQFNTLSHIDEIIGGDSGVGSRSFSESYIISDVDNPHTFTRTEGVINNTVIELTYKNGYTDGGDTLIVPLTSDVTISNSLILEGKTGTLANALGYSHTANYKVINCTLVGEYDPFYGALARTESGGTFDGTLEILSNIVYSKTQPSRLFLFEGNQNQLTNLNNNNYFGFTTIYDSVDNPGSTPGVTAGLGDQDSYEDPLFFDMSRNYSSWGLLNLGLSDSNLITAEIIKRKNGYDSTLNTQVPANKNPVNIFALRTWVKAGYAPQNPALEYASHTGGVVGAIPFANQDLIFADGFD